MDAFELPSDSNEVPETRLSKLTREGKKGGQTPPSRGLLAARARPAQTRKGRSGPLLLLRVETGMGRLLNHQLRILHTL